MNTEFITQTTEAIAHLRCAQDALKLAHKTSPGLIRSVQVQSIGNECGLLVRLLQELLPAECGAWRDKSKTEIMKTVIEKLWVVAVVLQKQEQDKISIIQTISCRTGCTEDEARGHAVGFAMKDRPGY